MSYRIEIDRQALKVLAALPKKVQRQIAERIDSLAEEPFPPDAQQIKGQEAIWRIRSGSYRMRYCQMLWMRFLADAFSVGLG
jgi:mRNA interferase RelE/StbE